MPGWNRTRPTGRGLVFQPKCTGVLTQEGIDPGGLRFGIGAFKPKCTMALPTQRPILQTSHTGGHAPDTKKTKVASCPGTRQKPSLEAPFGLFWAPEAPGALFDQIQAQILGSLSLLRSWGFWIKREAEAL